MLFQYLAFPCGLIRGALSNLGVACIVTAEVSTVPACEYTIHQMGPALSQCRLQLIILI